MSDLEPITREETFLNAIAEGEQPNLTPITREEWFLNKIAQNGGGGGGGSSTGGALYVKSESGVLDKTYKEITDAIENNQAVFIKEEDIFNEGYYFLSTVVSYGYINSVYAVNLSNNDEYSAESETGVLSNEGGR